LKKVIDQIQGGVRECEKNIREIQGKDKWGRLFVHLVSAKYEIQNKNEEIKSYLREINRMRTSLGINKTEDKTKIAVDMPRNNLIIKDEPPISLKSDFLTAISSKNKTRCHTANTRF
jgi:hypothetical protein